MEPGDVIRILKGGLSAGVIGGTYTWVDVRVTHIISDTQLNTDYAGTYADSTGYNYRILKCAAGRRNGVDHSALSITTNGANLKGIIPDDAQLAYLPHPELTFYQTWSYKYCEVDPGCCGFKVG